MIEIYFVWFVLGHKIKKCNSRFQTFDLETSRLRVCSRSRIVEVITCSKMLFCRLALQNTRKKRSQSQSWSVVLHCFVVHVRHLRVCLTLFINNTFITAHTTRKCHRWNCHLCVVVDHRFWLLTSIAQSHSLAPRVSHVLLLPGKDNQARLQNANRNIDFTRPDNETRRRNMIRSLCVRVFLLQLWALSIRRSFASSCRATTASWRCSALPARASNRSRKYVVRHHRTFELGLNCVSLCVFFFFFFTHRGEFRTPFDEWWRWTTPMLLRYWFATSLAECSRWNSNKSLFMYFLFSKKK